MLTSRITPKQVDYWSAAHEALQTPGDGISWGQRTDISLIRRSKIQGNAEAIPGEPHHPIRPASEARTIAPREFRLCRQEALVPDGTRNSPLINNLRNHRIGVHFNDLVRVRIRA